MQQIGSGRVEAAAMEVVEAATVVGCGGVNNIGGITGLTG